MSSEQFLFQKLSKAILYAVGGGSGYGPPVNPALDRVGFAKFEVDAVKSCPADEIKSDQRWGLVFGFTVSMEKRRLLNALARRLAASSRDCLSANAFYKAFAEEYGCSEGCIQNWVQELCNQGIITKRPGGHHGVEDQLENVHFIFFTRQQKSRMLGAQTTLLKSNAPAKGEIRLSVFPSGPDK